MKEMKGEREMTRRSFLDYGIRAIGAFITTILAVPVVGYVVSPALTKREAGWNQLGLLKDFRVQEPRLVEFTIFRKDGWVEVAEKKSVWVVRRNGTEFDVYNPLCTHLGCAYNWEADKKQFRSPCHNGLFDITGKVVGGPPPRPLDTLEHKIEGDKLLCIYKNFRLGIAEKLEL